MVSNDIDIFNSIRSGEDTHALRDLYLSQFPKIKSFILKNNGTDEEARDLFQDAILVLFEYVKLGKYKEEHDIGGFLYGVARRLWYTRVKKISRESFLEVDDHKGSYEEQPSFEILEPNTEAFVRGLLDDVGDRCRELLTYVFYKNLSMKEVAIKMGFSNFNVAKTKHYKCKKKLSALAKERQGTLITMSYE